MSAIDNWIRNFRATKVITYPIKPDMALAVSVPGTVVLVPGKTNEVKIKIEAPDTILRKINVFPDPKCVYVLVDRKAAEAANAERNSKWIDDLKETVSNGNFSASELARVNKNFPQEQPDAKVLISLPPMLRLVGEACGSDQFLSRVPHAEATIKLPNGGSAGLTAQTIRVNIGGGGSFKGWADKTKEKGTLHVDINGSGSANVTGDFKSAEIRIVGSGNYTGKGNILGDVDLDLLGEGVVRQQGKVHGKVHPKVFGNFHIDID